VERELTIKGIIGGTGYGALLSSSEFTPTEINTPFGDALVTLGSGQNGDLAFIPRHGADHSFPPHRVNYRANLMALYQLGVERIIALSTVGGLVESIPAGAFVLVDQLVDFTQGRDETFFDGGEWGTAHTDMTEPFCRALSTDILGQAASRGVEVQPSGVYMAFRGPRLETAAEIQVFVQLGGTVVGMTGAPEATLARELGMHYAMLCTSVNLAAGLEGSNIKFSRDKQAAWGETLLGVTIATLRGDFTGNCGCTEGRRILHQPTAWTVER
jgi:purine nucleoside phosphorylase